MKLNRAALCAGLFLCFCSAFTTGEAQINLVKATENGDVSAVKRALVSQKEQKLNSGYYNKTPIEAAIEKGDAEVVKLLIKNGADVNVSSHLDFGSPLVMAVKKGNLEIIRLLLDNKAKINGSFYVRSLYVGSLSMTPLMCAIDTKNPEIVELLLKGGADPNWTENPYMSSGFNYALRKSAALDITKLLVDSGANTNGALWQAYAYCDTDVISYLQSKGARLENNEDAFDALHTVLKRKSMPLLNMVIKQIQQEGLDLKECINYEHSRLCDSLITEAASLEFPEAVKLLLEKGADEYSVNYSDGMHDTALLQALKREDIDTAKLLMDHGADINAGSSDVPLLWAVKNKRIDIFELLLKNGADCNHVCHTRRLIQTKDLLKKRKQYGKLADMAERLSKGKSSHEYAILDYHKTPLFQAIECGYKDVAEWLLKNGAEKSVNEPRVLVMQLISGVRKRKKTNSEEEKITPLQMAKQMEREDLVDLLVRYGARE